MIGDVSKTVVANAPAGEALLQFKLGIERSKDAVFITDINGIITYVNPAFEKVYGYSSAEAVGQTPRILKSGILTPQLYEQFWQALLSKQDVAGEIINKTKDGRLVNIDGSHNPILDDERNILGFLAIHRDITERKQAEKALMEANAALQQANQELEQRVSRRTAAVSQEAEERKRTEQAEAALRKSESQFRRLAESSPDYIFILDLGQMRTVYANRDHFLGFSREEWQSRTVYRYLHPNDRLPFEQFFRNFGQALQTAEYLTIEYRLRSKEGHWSWIQHRGTLFAQDSTGKRRQALVILTDITERKRAEQILRESLERRRRVVEIGTQLAQQIAGASDLGELYQRVVTQIKEQLNYYHAQLLRYDPAVNKVVLIAGYGKIGEQMLASGHSMPMGIGLIGSAAATGQSVLSSDVATDPAWRPNPLLPETRGELAVPIKLGDEVLGVLDVQSNRVNYLNTDDQLALEGLSGQIAIAVESTRLRQEMTDRLGELGKLQQIMSREGWQGYQAQRQAELKGYTYDRISVIPTLPAKRPAVEAGPPATGNGRLVEQEPVTSNQDFVVAPLAIRGEVIGSFGIQNSPDDPLDPEDQELIASITAQVAAALESARLLEQTQKHAIEMETVARVSAVASTILDTQELLQTVADLTRERFNLYHVAVFLLDPEDKTLYWSTSTIPPVAVSEEELAKLRPHIPYSVSLSQPRSLVARAARERQPVIVNDTQADDSYLAHPLLPDTRSELTVPLVVGDSLLGVLDLQAAVPNRFTDDEVRIHTTLAAQVAVALQNSRLYAEQLDTAKRLREVDRLKSEFLASMSHELRTPLNSIIGFADVLLEGIDGPLSERMEEDVTLIRDSGRHLRELIGEILDMSKIEAGMMELRYEALDVEQLGREIVATARMLVKDKKLNLMFVAEPDLGSVEADRTRLTQVLLNLTSNAIKFTEKGSVILAVKDQGDEMLFSVEDTGIGMRAEDIPIIFEQFRQIDGSLTRKAGGSGLGMTISKSLVELHGGRMWVESQLGEGSTFWFTIPKEKRPRRKPDTGPLP